MYIRMHDTGLSLRHVGLTLTEKVYIAYTAIYECAQHRQWRLYPAGYIIG